MSQSELLSKVIVALDLAGAKHMLTGSHASSLQGEPRSTHDIDLVVDMTPAAARSLMQAFPPPNYYLDRQSIEDAIAQKSLFNLLDAAGGDKVDFWMLTDDPFDQSRFARRRAEDFNGQRIYVSTPEDTILMKLRWAQMSGGSEKQFGDARGVFETQHAKLDLTYIAHWASQLDTSELWERLKREARVT